MRAQLIPVDGGAAIDLTREVTVIGRTASCDVKLDHKSVSKLHCVLVKTDGLLLLRDLGSTNGTRVNGQRVRRAALLPHDQLNVASFAFKVSFGPAKIPVAPDENTQHLDAQELSRLRKGDEEVAPSHLIEPEAPIKVNALPDKYAPDDK